MDAIIFIIFPEYTLRKSIYTGEYQPLLSPLIYIYIKSIHTVERQPKAKNHLPQRIHPVTSVHRGSLQTIFLRLLYSFSYLWYCTVFPVFGTVQISVRLWYGAPFWLTLSTVQYVHLQYCPVVSAFSTMQFCSPLFSTVVFCFYCSFSPSIVL